VRTFGDEADNGMWPVLDLGVVHDSALTTRNDLCIFAEQRLQLLFDYEVKPRLPLSIVTDMQ